jgi:hypothetical protein
MRSLVVSLTEMSELHQPMRMISTEHKCDERFAHQHFPKGRRGILRPRLMASDNPCAVDVHTDQSEETDIREEIQAETIESACPQIVLELKLQIECAHPLTETNQRQQSIGEREKSQVGKGRVASQRALHENSECQHVQDESEEEKRIIMYEENRPRDRTKTRTWICRGDVVAEIQHRSRCLE